MKNYSRLPFALLLFICLMTSCKKDSLEEFEDLYPIAGKYIVDISSLQTGNVNQPLTISRISDKEIVISTYWESIHYASVKATVSKEYHKPKKKKENTWRIRYNFSFDKQEVANQVFVVGNGTIYED